MPLRVTFEMIPSGDESRKRKLAVVDITNDGTGTTLVGNYDLRAEGETVGGWDHFFTGKVSGVERGDYLDTAIECLRVLKASCPRTRFAAHTACQVEGCLNCHKMWIRDYGE